MLTGERARMKGRPPSPLARTLDPSIPLPAWTGAEGERVLDPVTPGVVWLGGARGGTRVAGATHVPAGTPNGGDVARARHNLRFRDATLASIEVRPPVFAAPFAVISRLRFGCKSSVWGGCTCLIPFVFQRSYTSQQTRHALPFLVNMPPPEPQVNADVKPDPNWWVPARQLPFCCVSLTLCRVHPLEEANGDASKARELTYEDLVQCVQFSPRSERSPHCICCRAALREEYPSVYCSPPEKWGVRASPVSFDQRASYPRGSNGSSSWTSSLHLGRFRSVLVSMQIALQHVRCSSLYAIAGRRF